MADQLRTARPGTGQPAAATERAVPAQSPHPACRDDGGMAVLYSRLWPQRLRRIPRAAQPTTNRPWDIRWAPRPGLAAWPHAHLPRHQLCIPARPGCRARFRVQWTTHPWCLTEAGIMISYSFGCMATPPEGSLTDVAANTAVMQSFTYGGRDNKIRDRKPGRELRLRPGLGGG